MAKSWKNLVKTTDSDSNNENGDSINAQLTLDQLALQNQELDNLLKERKSLENEMGDLLQPTNPVAEDPRFSGTIESFKSKREKEKNRAAQKRKLEERLLKNSKELKKWEQTQKRLKEKLDLKKKSLLKKETEQDPSTSLKAPKSIKKSFEKIRSKTDLIRKQKDVIERKKKVLTEEIKKFEKVPDKIKELKTGLDSFGQKDLVKFQQKLDAEKKNAEIPQRIRRIKDNWEEKHEAQKEKLREKVGLKKISEKLEETRRFGQSAKSEIKNSLDSVAEKAPEIKEMTDNLEKELSLDDRQNKASTKKSDEKESEQKDTNRREKLKEQFLSQKKAAKKEEERSSRKKERNNEKYI